MNAELNSENTKSVTTEQLVETEKKMMEIRDVTRKQPESKKELRRKMGEAQSRLTEERNIYRDMDTQNQIELAKKTKELEGAAVREKAIERRYEQLEKALKEHEAMVAHHVPDTQEKAGAQN